MPPWQCPSSPPTPPQGAFGGSGRRALPGGEAGPPGAQPLPRVLELAAPKAADSTAFYDLGSSDMTLQEVNAAAQAIFEMSDPDANIIFGAQVDDNTSNPNPTPTHP